MDNKEDGFTVVEVLVAFVITALGAFSALQIAGETSASLRRAMILDTEANEVEEICLRWLATGSLQAGTINGRFTDGHTWTLIVSDARAVLPLRVGPPLWRLRLTRGGPEGPVIYTTLVPGKPNA